ncbi:hypothetical protein BKA80DRAFT_253869 [Phyllosticta citrichinensis]
MESASQRDDGQINIPMLRRDTKLRRHSPSSSRSQSPQQHYSIHLQLNSAHHQRHISASVKALLRTTSSSQVCQVYPMTSFPIHSASVQIVLDAGRSPGSVSSAANGHSSERRNSRRHYNPVDQPCTFDRMGADSRSVYSQISRRSERGCHGAHL